MSIVNHPSSVSVDKTSLPVTKDKDFNPGLVNDFDERLRKRGVPIPSQNPDDFLEGDGVDCLAETVTVPQRIEKQRFSTRSKFATISGSIALLGVLGVYLATRDSDSAGPNAKNGNTVVNGANGTEQPEENKISIGAPVPDGKGGFELHGVNITIVPEHLFKSTPDGRTKVGMVHIPMDVHEKILAPFKEKGLTPDHDFDRYPDKKNRLAFIATTPNGGFIITYYKSFQGYCVPPKKQSDGSMSDGESFMFSWIKGLNSKENVPGKQNPAIRALFGGMQTIDSLDEKEIPKAFRSLPRGNYLPFMNGYLEMYINSAGLRKVTSE